LLTHWACATAPAATSMLAVASTRTKVFIAEAPL
jgi:hypothetical protein